jgi:predicted kinase
MRLALAVIGHISAGKTSTARRLAHLLGATYLGADDIQRTLGFTEVLHESLTTDEMEAIPAATFAEIRRRIDVAGSDDLIVIDATPTTPHLDRLLHEIRSLTHVVLLYCDTPTWTLREMQRTDRLPLPEEVRTVAIERAKDLNPGLAIDTSQRHTNDVLLEIVTWLRSAPSPNNPT